MMAQTSQAGAEEMATEIASMKKSNE